MTGRAAFLALLFAGVLFWRSPGLLLGPRLWAEEGRHYYAALQGADFLSVFELVVRGNFQLLANAIAWCATLVPARYAAYVTTYASLLFAAALAALVGVLSMQQRWPLWLGGAIVAVLALLPQGYEIYLTATNVQWVCSACMLVLAVIDAQDWKSPQRGAAYAFAAVAGLTGVCSAMLAPVFLARRWLARSPAHFRIGLILTGCAMLQIAVILGRPHPDRAFPLSPLILTLPLALQSVLSPLLGAGAVDDLIGLAGGRTFPSAWLAAIYVAAIIPAAFAVGAAWHASKDKVLALTLAGSWLGVSLINVIGSLGDPTSLISGTGASRYFFVGAACFVLLLGTVASAGQSWRRRMAAVLLVTMLAVGIAQIYVGEWKEGIVRGEPWQATVDRCGSTRPCKVEGWPGGQAWVFELTRP